MPVRTDPTTLRQIINPLLAVRKVNECRVDVRSDLIRLQTTSEDQALYADYSLPRPAPKAPDEDQTGSFWLYLERVDDFLNVGVSEDITITFPFETADSTAILQSEHLTYRFRPVVSQQPYRLFDDLAPDPVTEFSVQHGAFAQSVYVANLVGGKMRLRLDPETRHVEFSSTGREGGDTFTHTLSTDHINTVHGTSSEFTISIDRLRDVTPHVPDTTPASFQLTHNYLVYQVEYPLSGAQLTIYIAERLTNLRN
jgi:hypothetical protein